MHLVPIALRFNSGSNHHIVTPKIQKIASLLRFPTLTDDVIGMTISLKNGKGFEARECSHAAPHVSELLEQAPSHNTEAR